MDTIRQIERSLLEFEVKRDFHLLELAAGRIGQVSRRRRSEKLDLWLKVFALMDASFDPRYDPAERFMMWPPPPTSDSPAALEDFQRRLAEHRRLGEERLLQHRIRQYGEMFEEWLRGFIQGDYSPTPEDQQELARAIDRAIQNPERAGRIRKMIRR